MKIVAVSDAFMKEEYYQNCFAQYPEYELQPVLFFGDTDREAMRIVAHKI